jgi:hypothetical protein
LGKDGLGSRHDVIRFEQEKSMHQLGSVYPALRWCIGATLAPSWCGGALPGDAPVGRF